MNKIEEGKLVDHGNDEFRPNVWYSDLIEIDQNTSILCIAWHWEHEGKTRVRSLRCFKGHNKDANNDLKLCRFAWNLLDKADIVCGQNIDKFDLPLLNGRFYHHDLGPTRPYTTIDTLKLFKKFKLDRRSLDAVSKQKGLQRKLKTHGIGTWLGCVRWDIKEWQLMEEYNKLDDELRRFQFFLDTLEHLHDPTV